MNPPTADTTSSPETIGVTGIHPFWSLDRLEFVQVGELAIGERLQTLSGDTKWVQQKLPRPGPETVYNLEVHGEHVYYVGDKGVLAHNASCWDDGKGKWVWGASWAKALINAGRKIPDVLKGLLARLHGHHIVMKGNFTGWSAKDRAAVFYARRVLRDVGIGINDTRNLAHAINKGHSAEYAHKVRDLLYNAVRQSGDKKKNVEAVLDKIRETLERGGTL